MHAITPKVLIVEDELLISALLQRQLEQGGYRVVGSALSYDQAVELFLDRKPDIILIDIRLSGQKSGLDFAQYLRSLSGCPPFVFLTAQVDRKYLERAKRTLPAGYLNKPIQVNSLLSTIEVALYRRQRQESPPGMVTLKAQGLNYFVPAHDILYLRIEHVYVHTYLKDGGKMVERSTMTDFLNRLGRPEIIQTHRSYAVNLNHVSSFADHQLVLGQMKIPISRQRKKAVLRQLAEIQRRE